MARGSSRNFNSHAHVERDVHTRLGDYAPGISTHTLTWSVTYVLWACKRWYCISTHTLTWSVTACISDLPLSFEFQLTRSRGAWQKPSLHLRQQAHFNSHAHVERDRVWRGGLWQMKISTHTLTWSVTSAEIDQLQTEKISTHTLTWSVTALIVHRTPLLVFQLTRSRGAWHRGGWGSHRSDYFNSHAHVERDTSITDEILKYLISTHTLTWSVTTAFRQGMMRFIISTHTLTWSVTCTLTSFLHIGKFQLTRSRGAWLTRSIQQGVRRKFQLTRSRGAWRLTINEIASIWGISTHTLTWSVTSSTMSVSVVETISTHTLTWSVTASEDYCKGRHCISTHTLTWSVTNSVIAFRTITLISTHTLTWSVT